MGEIINLGRHNIKTFSEDFHPAKKDGFGPNWPISYDEFPLTMIH